MHLSKSPEPTTVVLKRLMQETFCGDALCVEAKVYLKCIYQSRPAPTTAVLKQEVQKTGTGTLYMDVYAAPICRIFKSKIQVKP